MGDQIHMTSHGRVPTYPSLAIDDAAEIVRQSSINLYGCLGDAPLGLAMTAIERQTFLATFPERLLTRQNCSLRGNAGPRSAPDLTSILKVSFREKWLAPVG